MSQANIDLGVFQENKLTKRIYTRESSGYRVVETEAQSAHSGGVAGFYREAEHFTVESLQTYGVNFVSFQLALGERRWFIMRCYLAPDDTSTIEDAVAAISKRLRGAALLVVGYFDTDLAGPEGQERYKRIAAAMAEEGLEDMSDHFLPRHKPWSKDGCT